MGAFTKASRPDFSDLDELKEQNDAYLLGKTGYSFLDEHRGLRPGKLHVLLGSTASGKTTLVRSIFNRLAKEQKCLWYASEESIDDWKLGFLPEQLPNIENTKFMSELDLFRSARLAELSIPDLVAMLEQEISVGGHKVVFFDNLTTSRFYNDKKPDAQFELVSKLKDLAQDLDCALFLVAHVSSNLPASSLYKSEHVRGSKSVSNLAEYWYNLHRIELPLEDRPASLLTFALLHVEKARSHPNSNKVYQLTFDLLSRQFVEDKPMTWPMAIEMIRKSINLKK